VQKATLGYSEVFLTFAGLHGPGLRSGPRPQHFWKTSREHAPLEPAFSTPRDESSADYKTAAEANRATVTQDASKTTSIAYATKARDSAFSQTLALGREQAALVAFAQAFFRQFATPFGGLGVVTLARFGGVPAVIVGDQSLDCRDRAGVVLTPSCHQ